MAKAPLKVTRAQVLAYRRKVGHLDERLPRGRRSLERAAWAGLQDSMPRAALLSIHARVEGTNASSWEDPAFVQLWGPRFSAYVVAARDRAIFTLGRLSEDEGPRRRAEDLAARLNAFSRGRRMRHDEAARGVRARHPNELRYAAPTGTVVMRWDGARQPTIWTLPRPDMDPGAARLELARRYLHIFGPSTPEAFATWAGLKPPRGRATFAALQKSLVPVRTPIGDVWILDRDEPLLRSAASTAVPAPARFLPSGDTFYLLQEDRELLIPQPERRRALWTSRVWPGALLVRGEIVGIWRRADALITAQSWQRLSRGEREAVEAEAASLPLPGVEGRIAVRWEAAR